MRPLLIIIIIIIMLRRPPGWSGVDAPVVNNNVKAST